MNALNHRRRGISKGSILGIISITVMLSFIIWSTVGAKEKASGSPDKRSSEEVSAIGELTIDKLKEKRTEIEGSKALADSAKKSALTFLEQAIRFREQLNQIEKEDRDLLKKIKMAPTRIKEIEAELKKSEPGQIEIESVTGLSDMDIKKLEQRIGQEEAALVEAKSELTSLANQLEKEEKRPQQLREQATNAKQRLTEIKAALNTAPPPEEPAQLTEARRSSLLIEQAKLQAEIKAHEQRLAGQDLLVPLLRGESTLATLDVKRRETLIKGLTAQAQKLRQEEAQKAKVAAAVAKFEASKMPQKLQKQFDMNIQLAEELENLLGKQTTVTKKLNRHKVRLKNLEEDFALARARIKTAIKTEVMGITLREQRQSLPNFRSYRRASEQRRSKMAEIQNRELEIDRTRQSLSDPKAEADRVIQELGPFPDELLLPLKTKIRTLLSDRLDLLEKLASGYNRYFKSLESLDFTDQRLFTIADEFAEFLDLNLMWIRSSKIFGPEDLRKIPSAMAWLTGPSHWRQVMSDLRDSLRRGPVAWTFGLLLGVGLVVGRRRMRRNLNKVAKGVGNVQSDSFLLTVRALVITAGLAAGWPILLGLVGWQLSILPIAHDFTMGIGKGITYVAIMLAVYGFFYYVCCKDGLAHVHFRWPEAVRQTLRRNLLWLTWLLVPLVFLIWAGNTIEYGDSVGRLVFMLATVGVSVFMARVLSFSGAIISMLRVHHPQGWLIRTRFIWYPLAVGLPLVMGVLAGVGYFYYTALTLTRQIMETYRLVIILVLVNHLLLRWLLIAKRRIVYKEAKRKQEEEAQERNRQAAERASAMGLDDKSIAVEEREIGPDQIDEHPRELIRMVMLFAGLIGLWLTWYEVLPALRFMTDVPLWSYRAELDGITKTFPITLSNVLVAVVVAAVLITVARNIPGVLDIVLLNRFVFDSGVRYAISAITRYTITAVGVIIVFRSIGVRWSQLQWLIAALSVGLGFGLQEIVANFVSGIIILFERPIRVGDIVTIDQTTGIVSRIRIRATTITDWDRKEYIVPNKEFVTGRLLNWTLSNPINRIVITVGVAYGSDTELARELLLKVAREHPLIMDDPAPLATFEGFGDNALNFVLRCYLPSMDRRLPTINELHMNIEKTFREAGITIAFPQRDVHFGTSSPIEVQLVPGKSSDD